jgi:hypothetical protein
MDIAPIIAFALVPSGCTKVALTLTYYLATLTIQAPPSAFILAFALRIPIIGGKLARQPYNTPEKHIRGEDRWHAIS